MPAGILRRGRIARASPMGKVRSMRAFPINERACHSRLRTHWNYVGRHGADKFSTTIPTDCPVDSRVAAQCLCSLFAGIRSRLWSSALDGFDHAQFALSVTAVTALPEGEPRGYYHVPCLISVSLTAPSMLSGYISTKKERKFCNGTRNKMPSYRLYPQIR